MIVGLIVVDYLRAALVITETNFDWLPESEWVFTPAQSRSRKGLEKLLRVAKDLFLEKGYDHTTITEISKASGVSVGSIYHRFPDKQAILVTVLEIYRQTRYQQMLEFAAPERWEGKCIRDVVEFHVGVIFSATRNDRGIYRLIERQRMASAKVNEQVVGWDAEICALLISIYQRCDGAASIASLPRKVEYLHNIIRGSVLWSILGPPPHTHFLDVDSEAFHEEALEMALKYLDL